MKIALIAGSSGVIGGACALALASEGYALALQYHLNEQAARDLLHRLPEGTPAFIFPADITKKEEVEALFAATRQRLGYIDVLINAAGTALPQMTLDAVTVEEMDHIYALNVRGAMLLSQAAIPHLIKKEGCMVHISSLWGIVGGACESVYSASKGAVNAFIKALAKELAPSRIRVNGVAPGLVPSPMNGHLTEEDLSAFAAATPLGSLVTAEQVAEAVCYLTNASMVTGQILSVDGGIVI